MGTGPTAQSETAHSGTVPVANCPRCQLGDCPRCLIVIACVSIASNIAEGSKRPDAYFRRFLSYSLGSLAKLDTQLVIAEMQGYAPYTHEMKSRIIGLMAAIRKFVAALRK
ncbi:MAG: four helix bundle protein [Kiritimatiellae bacterium]|nr:four helix bundle protein [Kiritimatiellia bacterium]